MLPSPRPNQMEFCETYTRTEIQVSDMSKLGYASKKTDTSPVDNFPSHVRRLTDGRTVWNNRVRTLYCIPLHTQKGPNNVYKFTPDSTKFRANI